MAHPQDPRFRPCRRQGRAPVPAHRVPVQACRSVRRPVPHHGLRAEQHDQFPHLFPLPARPVQIPVPHRACPPELEPVAPGAGPFRHGRSAADAHGPRLVPGHGRRRVPEHQPHLRLRSGDHRGLRLGPHLPDGHPADDRFPHRKGSGRDRGGPAGSQGAGRIVRRYRDGPAAPHHRIPGKTEAERWLPCPTIPPGSMRPWATTSSAGRC